MHCLLIFVDTRYSVVVPIIGVQVHTTVILSIRVWDKIAPAMASHFDAPYSVPPIEPRPLLLNGADDPRCPVLGLQEPASKAAEAYAEAGSADKFKDPKN
ncbi:hypothetical protein CFC21_070249 [Triticum aestivum]|uniref:Peptidase S9 prolyl oligopeptidase catalytic domain-containing protein n=2 Tax=Triticum aestivum TaxID=4565 RepID=A0A9R1HE13_WHEAT|nr:hypothetical protein CFC21_034536 [Triticum aestivum]KAF7063754.1 hypothetical protein CFC21_070249 [Triticum aestivum]